MDVHQLFDLSEHGPDTFVGIGPRYPWGGLYGGQIVAQALRAAASTVDDALPCHSLRAYFIRRGDHGEPVRYEVDRIRNGRTFTTRRVVARQAVGAILNLEASFQAAESSADVETVRIPLGLTPPTDALSQEAWSPLFSRVWIPDTSLGGEGRTGAGRAAAWLRTDRPIGDEPLLHQCMLAFLSDDLPTDAVVRAHPLAEEMEAQRDVVFSASLDHTMWFHRPLRVDEWHLHDFTCHSFVGGRGLTIGHIFAADGTHAATIAQEVLLRDSRRR